MPSARSQALALREALANPDIDPERIRELADDLSGNIIRSTSSGQAERNRRLSAALEDFKRAALLLSEAWDHADATVREYPSYLPSFDEFAADVMVMHVG